MKRRVVNETDETIIIEPGEAVDIRGDKEQVRLMSKRSEKLIVKDVE